MVSPRRSAYAQIVRLWFPYWQYTNLFIFRFLVAFTMVSCKQVKYANSKAPFTRDRTNDNQDENTSGYRLRVHETDPPIRSIFQHESAQIFVHLRKRTNSDLYRLNIRPVSCKRQTASFSLCSINENESVE